MALIEFKNLPDRTTPINSSNLNYNFNELSEKKLDTTALKNEYSEVEDEIYGCDYINNTIEKLEGEVLYDNSDGTNGEVSLSGNSVRYKYFEIFYKSNDDFYSSVKVYSPYGKKVNMYAHNYQGGSMYIKTKVVTIQNTNIINAQYNEYYFVNNGGISIKDDNNIYITRVVGYK